MYNTSEACCSINVVRLQLVSDSELRGCTQMARGPHYNSLSGAPTDVPGLQYTFLAVVWMAVSHFYSFPINLIQLIN